MKRNILIKSFLNEKREERYLIEDVAGNVLHRAGGPGFKTIETAEIFAISHEWTVIAKPEKSRITSLL